MSSFAQSSKPKAYTRRDHIRANERRIQSKWETEKIYQVSAEPGRPKYLVTFPYPYMNGKLHLGHAFSLTKSEFMARYQRLLGKNVLFPFAFHCTGMPIQAAANKLKEEIEKFGNPPNFDEDKEEAPEEKEQSIEAAVNAKSKGKKTKLAVKGIAGKVRQWQILSKMVPESIIADFSEPNKWLDYFSPIGRADLQNFGAMIDWRRSFITTSVNEFYDSFIKWQFNKLKEGKRIVAGIRPSVYSIKDKQVCADHDRASGEAVVPQEYTLIKLQVQQQKLASTSALNDPVLAGKRVFLVAATLRPETMYGQTNCFVLPEGEYGAFEFLDGEVLVMSERSANGLAHQSYSPEFGVVRCLRRFTGSELIGTPIGAPRTTYETVYVLPLPTISMGKGTGVVTSVPSDAPDDYAALKELKDKPLWREKFGLTDDMVMPFEVIPIIDIPGYGDRAAVTLCEKLDIKSCKEADKLKEAKAEVYLKGFYEGVMLVGECKGMKVMDAKPLVKKAMLEAGEAIVYFEPESTVISRSGDECIVAITDQWYLQYGEADWKSQVSDLLNGSRFDSFSPDILDSLNKAVNWLREWACSREFGLGTRLPWDQKWLIDSLSDSTIYMAYYTIAHFFHASGNLKGDLLNGEYSGADFDDHIFSYIFLQEPFPAGYTTRIPMDILNTMRQEFEYWYPVDLRVSAKDLIPNHLTMYLYNHAEIFKNRPEMLPKGIYCNGHIMVDAEKMSKSKGNFLLMEECIEEYSADAMRFALADAGDSLEDANFDRSVANQAVTYLFTEEEWIREVLKDIAEGKLTESMDGLVHQSVANELNYLIEATKVEFDRMHFRDGLHRCWFDMMILRDFYRDWCIKCEQKMNSHVILRFIEALAVMMAPVTPHWSEVIWEALGHQSTIFNEVWPVASEPVNKNIRKEFFFLRDFIKNIRVAALKGPQSANRGVNIFVANTYDASKTMVLQYMVTRCNHEGKFSADFMKDIKQFLETNPSLKPETKNLMQFASFMRDESHERGIDALSVEVPFSQGSILAENLAYIQKSLNMQQVNILNLEEPSISDADRKKAQASVPGKPAFAFFNVTA